MIRVTDEISPHKGGFIWGYSTTSMIDAGDVDNRYPFNKYSTCYQGCMYEWRKPPVSIGSWHRYRNFLGFDTEGAVDAGWIEQVKLKLWIQDVRSEDMFSLMSDGDYSIRVYSVPEADRYASYKDTYGFGPDVSITISGMGVDDWILMESWEEIANFSFYDHEAVATTKYYDANGDLKRALGGYIYVNLPVNAVNNLGETHLSIATLDELNSIDPKKPSYPTHTINKSAVYAGVSPLVPGREPILQIIYVSPSDEDKDPSSETTLGELRIHDLSIQRKIQHWLDQSLVFSGTYVRDGYPFEEQEFVEARNITVEHENTIESALEVSGTRGEMDRLFSVDVVCDQRGELNDLTEVVVDGLHGSIPIWDFHYGFINPPRIGTLGIIDIDVVEVEPVLGSKYHNLITFSAIVLRG